MSVVKVLKKAGIYEVNHLFPTRTGFHEPDLTALMRKLIDLARGSGRPHFDSRKEGVQRSTYGSLW